MDELYVIPGSHACRAAMLMLEHKQVPYRRVDVMTGLHPLVSRLHGFGARGETRVAGARRPLGLRIGDLLGTVPGLAADGRRVSTNREIARFLDDRHPEPPLLPADPEERKAVEEAEHWANTELQMAARRIAVAWAVHDPSAMSRATADGRMGPLLYRRAAARRLIIPLLRFPFAVDGSAGDDLLADLPPMLDRVDAWIADGRLNGARWNVADFMVAPSLALVLYRPDALALFEDRPALDLVDRLLPEPAS
jgi:glutathione S-transferase